MDDALRRGSAFADRALENTRGVVIIIGVPNDVQLSPVSAMGEAGDAWPMHSAEPQRSLVEPWRIRGAS